jgi:hypothetical protein
MKKTYSDLCRDICYFSCPHGSLDLGREVKMKTMVPQILEEKLRRKIVQITGQKFAITVLLPRGWVQEIKRMYPVLPMHGLFLT